MSADGARRLEALFDAHAGPLWRYVVHLTGDRGGADDVVQETLLRAWRTPRILEQDPASTRSWMFTVARHLVIDDVRSAHHRREIAVAERAVAFWNDVGARCAVHNQGRALLFDQMIPSLRAIGSGSDGITDWAELTIGIRLPLDVDPDALAEELAAQAGGVDDYGGPPELRFRGGCRAYRGDKNNPLVRAFLKGVRGAGGTPGFLLKTGTSDMNVVGPAWRCPILAYGPGDSSLDHTPHEHVVVAELLRAVDVLEGALRQLTNSLS